MCLICKQKIDNSELLLNLMNYLSKFCGPCTLFWKSTYNFKWEWIQVHIKITKQEHMPTIPVKMRSSKSTQSLKSNQLSKSNQFSKSNQSSASNQSISSESRMSYCIKSSNNHNWGTVSEQEKLSACSHYILDSKTLFQWVWQTHIQIPASAQHVPWSSGAWDLLVWLNTELEESCWLKLGEVKNEFVS